MTEGTAYNVPISVVAKIMGKSSMFVRIGWQIGLLPFGAAFETDASYMQFDYYVSPKLLYEYTGYMYEPNEDDIQIHIVTAEKCSSVFQKRA